MHGYQGRRSRWVIGFAVLGLLALPMTVSAAPATNGGPAVYLDGQRIEGRAAANLFCHDRDYPLIRCFRTAADRAAEESGLAGAPDGAVAGSVDPASLLSPYVSWYRDANFSGPSFEAYVYEPDLAALGWDNQISSFMPLNGGHPLWWTGPNRTGTKWDWGTASAATLGAANDQFSSTDKG
jgi:hypothetical protein